MSECEKCTEATWCDECCGFHWCETCTLGVVIMGPNGKPTGMECECCGEFLCNDCHPGGGQVCMRCLWVDGPDSEARRAHAEDRGQLVRLDPVQGVGFRNVEPSCGELGLELDVQGVKGTVYVSREMWTALGQSMGWCQDDVSDGMQQLGAQVLEEATSALQWYRGGMRVAQAPRLSRAAALHIADMAWRLGVGEDPHQ